MAFLSTSQPQLFTQAMVPQFQQHINFASQQLISAAPPPAASSSKPGGSEIHPGTVVDNGKGIQYRTIQELGAGCFGSVHKVQRTADGKIMAMKFQTMKDAQQIAEVQKEVGMLKRLRHANTVSFFEDFTYKRYICIVMEFCSGGTLQGHIKSRQKERHPLSALRVAGYVAQLADGLAFIHSKNVTHRDLKSENIMMTKGMDIKISDFGCGRQVHGGGSALTMTGGDLMIIPPEMAHRAQGIPKVGSVGPPYDMWGLGVITSEMVLMKLHRKDICRNQPLCLDKQAESQILLDARHTHEGKFSSLLSHLLEHDPHRRWTAGHVQEHVRQLFPPMKDTTDISKLKSTAAKLGVSESQLQEAFDNFTRADTRNSGQITVNQLHQLLVVLNIQMSSRAITKQFDSDGNGLLSFTEFAKWWLKKDVGWMPTVTAKSDVSSDKIHRVFGIPKEDYIKLKEGFTRYDTEESSTITAIAMYSLLQGIGIDMGSDFSGFLDACGSDWQESSFSFDDVLHWGKHNVSWSTHTFWPNKLGLPSAAVSTPGKSSSAKISSSTTSGVLVYKVGDPVLVQRSDKSWSPAEVTEVKASSYMVTYTEKDKGSSKEIAFNLAGNFLMKRHAERSIPEVRTV